MASTASVSRGNILGYIDGIGIVAPPPGPDDAMEVFEQLDRMAEVRQLDLADEQLSSVIWANGFTGNFLYLSFDVGHHDHSIPIHTDGASPVDGFNFCGFRWLRIEASGLISGSCVDAKVIADHIRAANSARRLRGWAGAIRGSKRRCTGCAELRGDIAGPAIERADLESACLTPWEATL